MPCVLKLSPYRVLVNGAAFCEGIFTVVKEKEIVQLSSSGFPEDRRKKALEQCVLVFSKC